MKRSRLIQGFTLIELMVVIALIAALAAVAIPMVGSTVRHAAEGTSKGNLAAIRGMISVYYTNNEGLFPTDNLASLVPSFATQIPNAKTPGYHPDQNLVVTETVPTDTGAWSYNNVPGDAGFGTIHIGCTHPDTQGKAWFTY